MTDTGRHCKRKGCSNTFNAIVKGKKYCCPLCVDLASKERRDKWLIAKYTGRLCVECNAPIPFRRASNKGITCSPECARERGINRLTTRIMPPCVFLGCDGLSATKKGKYAGLCSAHRQQLKEGRALTRVVRKQSTSGTCSFGGCVRKIKAQGYCATHYAQRLSGNDLVPIKLMTSERRDWVPVGTTKMTVQGYVRVKTENGWVRHHRSVMERHIGRSLESNEQVHHINGDRSDNRIENLELWSRSQPPGQRVLEKLAWAREILDQYESEEALLQPMLFSS